LGHQSFVPIRFSDGLVVFKVSAYPLAITAVWQPAVFDISVNVVYRRDGQDVPDVSAVQLWGMGEQWLKTGETLWHVNAQEVRALNAADPSITLGVAAFFIRIL